MLRTTTLPPGLSPKAPGASERRQIQALGEVALRHLSQSCGASGMVSKRALEHLKWMPFVFPSCLPTGEKKHPFLPVWCRGWGWRVSPALSVYKIATSRLVAQLALLGSYEPSCPDGSGLGVWFLCLPRAGTHRNTTSLETSPSTSQKIELRKAETSKCLTTVSFKNQGLPSSPAKTAQSLTFADGHLDTAPPPGREPGSSAPGASRSGAPRWRSG